MIPEGEKPRFRADENEREELQNRAEETRQPRSQAATGDQQLIGAPKEWATYPPLIQWWCERDKSKP
jgi:hypothetical protein